MSPIFVLILFLMGTDNTQIELNLSGFTSYHSCADTKEWFTEHDHIRDDTNRIIYQVNAAVCLPEKQS